MFQTTSMNTESEGSSDTLVTEIKNPRFRGDKPATTCVSHFAALGIVQWAEIIMSEGERFSINQVHPLVLGILTACSPIGDCQYFRVYDLRFGEQKMNELCVSGTLRTV